MDFSGLNIRCDKMGIILCSSRSGACHVELEKTYLIQQELKGESTEEKTFYGNLKRFGSPPCIRNNVLNFAVVTKPEGYKKLLEDKFIASSEYCETKNSKECIKARNNILKDSNIAQIERNTNCSNEKLQGKFHFKQFPLEFGERNEWLYSNDNEHRYDFDYSCFKYVEEFGVLKGDPENYRSETSDLKGNISEKCKEYYWNNCLQTYSEDNDSEFSCEYDSTVDSENENSQTHSDDPQTDIEDDSTHAQFKNDSKSNSKDDSETNFHDDSQWDSEENDWQSYSEHSNSQSNSEDSDSHSISGDSDSHSNSGDSDSHSNSEDSDSYSNSEDSDSDAADKPESEPENDDHNESNNDHVLSDSGTDSEEDWTTDSEEDSTTDSADNSAVSEEDSEHDDSHLNSMHEVSRADSESQDSISSLSCVEDDLTKSFEAGHGTETPTEIGERSDCNVHQTHYDGDFQMDSKGIKANLKLDSVEELSGTELQWNDNFHTSSENENKSKINSTYNVSLSKSKERKLQADFKDESVIFSEDNCVIHSNENYHFQKRPDRERHTPFNFEELKTKLSECLERNVESEICPNRRVVLENADVEYESNTIFKPEEKIEGSDAEVETETASEDGNEQIGLETTNESEIFSEDSELYADFKRSLKLLVDSRDDLESSSYSESDSEWHLEDIESHHEFQYELSLSTDSEGYMEDSSD